MTNTSKRPPAPPTPRTTRMTARPRTERARQLGRTQYIVLAVIAVAAIAAGIYFLSQRAPAPTADAAATAASKAPSGENESSQEDSDEEDDNASALAALADALSKTKMTPEYGEYMAKMLLADELKANKLTLKQASDYALCANMEYAERFSKHPSSGKFLENVTHGTNGKNMSAAEKTKLDEELKKATEEFAVLKDQSEEVCSKRLSLSVPRGKVL